MGRAARLATTLACVAALACTSAPDGAPMSSPDGAPGVRQQLVAEIRARLDAIESPEPVDSSRVHFARVASRAVPGLTFETAFFNSRVYPHSFVNVVAATRDGTTRVLRTSADLGHVAGEWRPASAHDAAMLCAESARYGTGARWLPIAPPFVVGLDGDTLPFMIDDDETIARRAGAPVVDRTAGGWRVRLWAIGYGITRRYDCRVGEDAGTLRVDVTPIDSIPRAGFMSMG